MSGQTSAQPGSQHPERPHLPGASAILTDSGRTFRVQHVCVEGQLWARSGPVSCASKRLQHSKGTTNAVSHLFPTQCKCDGEPGTAQGRVQT